MNDNDPSGVYAVRQVLKPRYHEPKWYVTRHGAQATIFFPTAVQADRAMQFLIADDRTRYGTVGGAILKKRSLL